MRYLKDPIQCFLFVNSGAFKFRGACNAIFSLNKDQADKGVVTHSRFAPCSLWFTVLTLKIADCILQKQWQPRCSIGLGCRLAGYPSICSYTQQCSKLQNPEYDTLQWSNYIFSAYITVKGDYHSKDHARNWCISHPSL